MELGKPSMASIGAWIGLILITGYLVWSSTKKTDTENYTKGATHNESTVESTIHVYPMGCSRLVLDGMPNNPIATDLKKQDQKKKN